MRDDIHLLAGAYALDALEGDELAFFDRHLEGCADCRAEVDAYSEALGALHAGVAEEPPASLRSAVLDEVARTPQEQRTPPAGQPPATAGPVGGGRRRLIAVAAALAILAVGTTASAVVLWQENARLAEIAQEESARADQQTALAEEQSALAEEQSAVAEEQRELARLLAGGSQAELEGEGTGSARFVWDAATDEGVLVADGFAQPDADEAYQLWVIADDEPQSAGLFTTADDGSATFPAEASLEGAQAVAITIEPEGGSPAPTGDILYVGDL